MIPLALYLLTFALVFARRKLLRHRRHLRAVPVPTRVLVGSGDVVAPHDELRRHLAADGELIVLEGLGHFFSRRPGAGPVDHGQLDPALDEAIADLLDAASRA